MNYSIKHFKTNGKKSVYVPVPVSSSAENTANITKDTVHKSPINHHHDAITKQLEALRTIPKLQSIHDVNRVNTIVNELLLHLPGPVTPEKLCRYDVSLSMDWQQIADNEYAAIQNELIRLFDNDWPVKNNTIEPNVLRLFSIDHSADFVLATISNIFDKENVVQFEKLAIIFEACICSEKWLLSAFIDYCYAESETELRTEDQDHFIQLLIAAPNKIANYFLGKHSRCFDFEQFSCILLLALVQAILFIAEMNKVHQKMLFGTKFLGQLFGRIAVDYNSNRASKILPEIFKVITTLAAKSTELKTTLRDMMLHLPRRSLDTIAWYMLYTDNPIELLIDVVKLSSDWEFVLHTKLPLSPPTSYNDQFLQNLIGTLSKNLSPPQACSLLEDVGRAWSSKVSIKSHTIDQHIYLTKFLVLSVELFAFERGDKFGERICMVIHNGVKNHMEILDEQMRAIGMMTAEIVLNKLNKHEDEETKLHFDYNGFSAEIQKQLDEIKRFSQTKVVMEKQFNEVDLNNSISILYAIVNSIDESKSIENDVSKKSQSIQNTTIEIGSLPSQSGVNSVLVAPKRNLIDEDDLDSDDDDDLQPYDMSNDTALIEDKRPKFLRDLQEALVETEDPEVFEQSMVSCASLIELRLPNEQSDIGVKLLRVLIELDARFHMENFDYHRMSGCIAICCIQPKECAEFLCKEIHSEVGRYSIGKKVLMMEILGESAKVLAKLTNVKECKVPAIKSETDTVLRLIDETDDTHRRLEEAKRIVSERIEKKTRRFAHPTANIFKGATPNKFANVAGSFFFPLLYGIGKDELKFYGMENALKHDTDNILLLNLLRTIGTITFASQNCPIINKITPEVLQLGTALRFHTESKIRLAVLQMIAAALLSTPKALLQLHFSVYLMEIKDWLEDRLSLHIVKGEKDKECRELSQHILAICLDALTADI